MRTNTTKFTCGEGRGQGQAVTSPCPCHPPRPRVTPLSPCHRPRVTVPVPVSPTATAIRMGQRMIHHTAAFSFLSQHLERGRSSALSPPLGTPPWGQWCPLRVTKRGGAQRDSPLVLVEVAHHHPRHHEEHGGACGDGVGDGGWGPRRGDNWGHGGDMWLTPAEEEEGGEAAVTREGGQDQQLVQEEPLGQ